MSRQIQHSEINNLINSNEIKLDCARVGCCIRYYLTFPNNNHKYYYNSNKSISIILQNKISKHLYTMSSTRLNKKTTIPNDTVDIKSKFNYTAGGQVVRKDKFREFVSEYKKIQDESPLTSALDVEFEIHVHIRETDKKSGEFVEKTKKIWIPLTTVYGGVRGVKLYIKNEIINIVYGYEDSDTEILSMRLIKLYIGKKNNTKHISKI